eukprot:364723-Chlamydomonas_euryale.AAC.10
MVSRRALQRMRNVLCDWSRIACCSRFSYCLFARSGAEDGCVEQLKLGQGHRNIEVFSGTHSSAIGVAMRKGEAVAPENRAAVAEQVWAGRPGGA